MPAKSINMHGKIYDLADEKSRTKDGALKLASEIRQQGKVAFLNPIKRKGQETMYCVYQAEKAVRNMSTRKNVSIKEILEQYSKGQESYGKWMDTLREAQKEVPKKEVLKKETPKKETPKKVVPKKIVSKKSNKKIPKKVVPKKKSNKKK